jgi:hypothetical protein
MSVKLMTYRRLKTDISHFVGCVFFVEQTWFNSGWTVALATV